MSSKAFIAKRDGIIISYFQAFSDLIKSFGWKSFTILYQDNRGLVRLQELLKAPTQSDIKIVVRQLSFKDEQNK